MCLYRIRDSMLIVTIMSTIMSTFPSHRSFSTTESDVRTKQLEEELLLLKGQLAESAQTEVKPSKEALKEESGSIESETANEIPNVESTEPKPKPSREIPVSNDSVNENEAPSARDVRLQRELETMNQTLSDMHTSQNGSTDVVNDPIESDVRFPINEHFALMHETKMMIEGAKSWFAEYIRVRNKTLVASSDFKFFKNPGQAHQFANSNNLFIGIKAVESISRNFSNAILQASNNLKPVGMNYIREISRAIRNHAPNISEPMMAMNPGGVNVTGKTVYGASHGLFDLIHFFPCEFTRLAYKLTYDMRESTPKAPYIHTHVELSKPIQMKDDRDLKNISYFANTDLRSFESLSELNFDSMEDKYSIFRTDTTPRVMEMLYDIDVKVSVSFNRTGESQRRSIYTNNSDDKNATNDGFIMVDQNIEGLKINPYCKEFNRIFAALMLMNQLKINDSERTSIMNYISSVVHEYALSEIKQIHTTQICHLTFDYTITRKVDSADLPDTFVELVDKGDVVPITPLHFAMYLDKKIDYESWLQFAFYSSIVCIRINKILRSIVPEINLESKDQMIHYAINKRRLDTRYYESDFTMEWQRDMYSVMTFRDYMKEMFIRSMLDGESPTYLKFITEASWIGSQGTSTMVHPATYNPIFCKFGLEDNASHFDNTSRAICMDSPDFKCPEYVRRTTRLSESMPNIYHMYLPTIFTLENDNE